MRALLIANTADTDAGFVGHALRKRGYSFLEVMRDSHLDWVGDIGRLLDHAELVVSMGSPWSVYWDHVAPAVDAEVALIQAALARNIPVLGICFGAQILTRATGGVVERAPEAEIGWCEVSVEPDLASESAVLAGKWMQWHYDRCLPPLGARILASSDRAVQAFHLPKALGVQFHPEANESIVASWSSGEGVEELAAHGTTVEAVLTETRRNVTSAEQRCDRLIEWFLASIAQ
jgi:GMP synthase-like glutamine amidotransferase